jgi:hypothetical protein
MRGGLVGDGTSRLPSRFDRGKTDALEGELSTTRLLDESAIVDEHPSKSGCRIEEALRASHGCLKLGGASNDTSTSGEGE